mgnify:FL=1
MLQCDVVVLSLRDLFQAVYQLSQQRRASRTSSTVSVESASRSSISSSNTASLSTNRTADNSTTHELPFNITEPSSPTSTGSSEPGVLSGGGSESKIENPPDVIPVVALTAETIPEVQEDKQLNLDEKVEDEAVSTEENKCVDNVEPAAEASTKSDAEPHDTSILKQVCLYASLLGRIEWNKNSGISRICMLALVMKLSVIISMLAPCIIQRTNPGNS